MVIFHSYVSLPDGIENARLYGAIECRNRSRKHTESDRPLPSHWLKS